MNVQMLEPSLEPLILFLRPSFTIRAAEGSLQVLVSAAPAPQEPGTVLAIPARRKHRARA